MIKKSGNAFKLLWNAVIVLQDRISRLSIFNFGLYLVLSIGLFLSGLFIQNNIRFVERNLVYVANEPLFTPLWICLFLVANFLAIMNAIQISREHDRGTYEVLCFGPVDGKTFLLGGFLAQLKVYGFILVGVLVWANFISWIFNLSFSFKVFFLLFQSIFMTAAMIGLGMLSSVWGKRTRATLVAYFFLILIIVGIEIGDGVINNLVMTGQTVNESILFLRNAFALLSDGVEWISPFAQMNLAMTALSTNMAGKAVFHTGIMFVQASLLVVVSIMVLQRKESRS